MQEENCESKIACCKISYPTAGPIIAEIDNITWETKGSTLGHKRKLPATQIIEKIMMVHWEHNSKRAKQPVKAMARGPASGAGGRGKTRRSEDAAHCAVKTSIICGPI